MQSSSFVVTDHLQLTVSNAKETGSGLKLTRFRVASTQIGISLMECVEE